MKSEYNGLIAVLSVIALVGLTGIVAISGASYAKERERMDNAFAKACNATGGVARRIDGMLNCVRETK